MEFYIENPQNVERADIVVAIPSFNEAEFIAYPTIQTDKGLVEYFGDLNSVIINCDNRSQDATKEVFFNTPTEMPKIYISTPEGVRGKGSNLRNLFHLMVKLGAGAAVVVDADLKSITPKWVANLGGPILKGFGLVAPLYIRHKYEDAITSMLVYPMTRALYGRRVRNPIGGDLAISGDMAELFLREETWPKSASGFGIDLWMIAMAARHRIPICQSFVGHPKIHRNAPFEKSEALLKEMLETLFTLMVRFDDFWPKVRWSKPTALYGLQEGEMDVANPVSIDEEDLHVRFIRGFETFEELWRRVINESYVNKLSEVKGLSLSQFNFPTHLWAGVLYDFALAYKRGEVEPSGMINSILPIFYGRMLSFARKTERMSTPQADDEVEQNCLVFEETKSYLAQRWFD